MASLVLIETNGSVKSLKAKELSIDTLYKKCGFRVNEDFLCRHTWRVNLKELYIVSVWAKKTGKANFENKYDFPPPIDKDLFFGTCAIVRTAEDGTFLDLTKEDWEKIYEKLFGGFEDLGDEDEYSEDELANVDPALLTTNGYLKDGFVVSDKEALEDDSTSSGHSTPIVKKKRIVKKDTCNKDTCNKDTNKDTNKCNKDTNKDKCNKNNKPKKETKCKKEVKEPETETDTELEEEVYTFSDEE